MIHDDVSRHLGEARTYDRAAVPLGIYVAWCANLQLLAPALAEQAAELVLRVRFREITGAELLIVGCAGVLADEHLNDEGQRFTAAYLPNYHDDFLAVFGDDPYAVKDDWANYDRIAPLLTRRLMALRHGADASDNAVVARPDRSWWRRFR